MERFLAGLREGAAVKPGPPSVSPRLLEGVQAALGPMAQNPAFAQGLQTAVAQDVQRSPYTPEPMQQSNPMAGGVGQMFGQQAARPEAMFQGQAAPPVLTNPPVQGPASPTQAYNPDMTYRPVKKTDPNTGAKIYENFPMQDVQLHQVSPELVFMLGEQGVINQNDAVYQYVLHSVYEPVLDENGVQARDEGGYGIWRKRDESTWTDTDYARQKNAQAAMGNFNYQLGFVRDRAREDGWNFATLEEHIATDPAYGTGGPKSLLEYGGEAMAYANEKTQDKYGEVWYRKNILHEDVNPGWDLFNAAGDFLSPIANIAGSGVAAVTPGTENTMPDGGFNDWLVRQDPELLTQLYEEGWDDDGDGVADKFGGGALWDAYASQLTNSQKFAMDMLTDPLTFLTVGGKSIGAGGKLLTRAGMAGAGTGLVKTGRAMVAVDDAMGAIFMEPLKGIVKTGVKAPGTIADAAYRTLRSGATRGGVDWLAETPLSRFADDWTSGWAQGRYDRHMPQLEAARNTPDEGVVGSFVRDEHGQLKQVEASKWGREDERLRNASSEIEGPDLDGTGNALWSAQDGSGRAFDTSRDISHWANRRAAKEGSQNAVSQMMDTRDRMHAEDGDNPLGRSATISQRSKATIHTATSVAERRAWKKAGSDGLDPLVPGRNTKMSTEAIRAEINDIRTNRDPELISQLREDQAAEIHRVFSSTAPIQVDHSVPLDETLKRLDRRYIGREGRYIDGRTLRIDDIDKMLGSKDLHAKQAFYQNLAALKESLESTGHIAATKSGHVDPEQMIWSNLMIEEAYLRAFGTNPGLVKKIPGYKKLFRDLNHPKYKSGQHSVETAVEGLMWGGENEAAKSFLFLYRTGNRELADKIEALRFARNAWMEANPKAEGSPVFRNSATDRYFTQEDPTSPWKPFYFNKDGRMYYHDKSPYWETMHRGSDGYPYMHDARETMADAGRWQPDGSIRKPRAFDVDGYGSGIGQPMQNRVHGPWRPGEVLMALPEKIDRIEQILSEPAPKKKRVPKPKKPVETPTGEKLVEVEEGLHLPEESAVSDIESAIPDKSGEMRAQHAAEQLSGESQVAANLADQGNTPSPAFAREAATELTEVDAMKRLELLEATGVVDSEELMYWQQHGLGPVDMFKRIAYQMTDGQPHPDAHRFLNPSEELAQRWAVRELPAYTPTRRETRNVLREVLGESGRNDMAALSDRTLDVAVEWVSPDHIVDQVLKDPGEARHMQVGIMSTITRANPESWPPYLRDALDQLGLDFRRDLMSSPKYAGYTFAVPEAKARLAYIARALVGGHYLTRGFAPEDVAQLLKNSLPEIDEIADNLLAGASRREKLRSGAKEYLKTTIHYGKPLWDYIRWNHDIRKLVIEDVPGVRDNNMSSYESAARYLMKSLEAGDDIRGYAEIGEATLRGDGKRVMKVGTDNLANPDSAGLDWVEPGKEFIGPIRNQDYRFGADPIDPGQHGPFRSRDLDGWHKEDPRVHDPFQMHNVLARLERGDRLPEQAHHLQGKLNKIYEWDQATLTRELETLRDARSEINSTYGTWMLGRMNREDFFKRAGSIWENAVRSRIRQDINLVPGEATFQRIQNELYDDVASQIKQINEADAMLTRVVDYHYKNGDGYISEGAWRRLTATRVEDPRGWKKQTPMQKRQGKILDLVDNLESEGKRKLQNAEDWLAHHTAAGNEEGIKGSKADIARIHRKYEVKTTVDKRGQVAISSEDPNSIVRNKREINRYIRKAHEVREKYDHIIPEGHHAKIQAALAELHQVRKGMPADYEEKIAQIRELSDKIAQSPEHGHNSSSLKKERALLVGQLEYANAESGMTRLWQEAVSVMWDRDQKIKSKIRRAMRTQQKNYEQAIEGAKKMHSGGKLVRELDIIDTEYLGTLKSGKNYKGELKRNPDGRISALEDELIAIRRHQGYPRDLKERVKKSQSMYPDLEFEVGHVYGRTNFDEWAKALWEIDQIKLDYESSPGTKTNLARRRMAAGMDLDEDLEFYAQQVEAERLATQPRETLLVESDWQELDTFSEGVGSIERMPGMGNGLSLAEETEFRYGSILRDRGLDIDGDIPDDVPTYDMLYQQIEIERLESYGYVKIAEHVYVPYANHIMDSAIVESTYDTFSVFTSTGEHFDDIYAFWFAFPELKDARVAGWNDLLRSREMDRFGRIEYDPAKRGGAIDDIDYHGEVVDDIDLSAYGEDARIAAMTPYEQVEYISSNLRKMAHDDLYLDRMRTALKNVSASDYYADPRGIMSTGSPAQINTFQTLAAVIGKQSPGVDLGKVTTQDVLKALDAPEFHIDLPEHLAPQKTGPVHASWFNEPPDQAKHVEAAKARAQIQNYYDATFGRPDGPTWQDDKRVFGAVPPREQIAIQQRDQSRRMVDQPPQPTKHDIAELIWRKKNRDLVEMSFDNGLDAKGRTRYPGPQKWNDARNAKVSRNRKRPRKPVAPDDLKAAQNTLDLTEGGRIPDGMGIMWMDPWSRAASWRMAVSEAEEVVVDNFRRIGREQFDNENAAAYAKKVRSTEKATYRKARPGEDPEPVTVKRDAPVEQEADYLLDEAAIASANRRLEGDGYYKGFTLLEAYESILRKNKWNLERMAKLMNKQAREGSLAWDEAKELDRLRARFDAYGDPVKYNSQRGQERMMEDGRPASAHRPRGPQSLTTDMATFQVNAEAGKYNIELISQKELEDVLFRDNAARIVEPRWVKALDAYSNFVSQWSRWKLLNPLNIMRFMVLNMVGDFTQMIGTGHTDAVMYAMKSIGRGDVKALMREAGSSALMHTNDTQLGKLLSNAGMGPNLHGIHGTMTTTLSRRTDDTVRQLMPGGELEKLNKGPIGKFMSAQEHAEHLSTALEWTRRRALFFTEFQRRMINRHNDLGLHILDRAGKMKVDGIEPREVNALLHQQGYGVSATELFDDLMLLGKTHSTADTKAIKNWADRVARDWTSWQKSANDESLAVVNKVLFDYKMGDVDQVARLFIPFHFWATRAIPLYAEMAMRNPYLISAYFRAVSAMDRRREQGQTPGFMDNVVEFFFSPAGFMTFTNPLSAIGMISLFADAARSEGVDDETFLGTLTRMVGDYGGINLSPWFSAALNMSGMYGTTNRGMDPTGFSRERRLLGSVVQWANMEGLIPGMNPELLGKPFDQRLREGREILSRIMPGVDTIESTNANAASEVSFQYIMENLIRERDGMADDEPLSAAQQEEIVAAWTMPDDPLYQQALKIYSNGNLNINILNSFSPMYLFGQAENSPYLEHMTRQEQALPQGVAMPPDGDPYDDHFLTGDEKVWLDAWRKATGQEYKHGDLARWQSDTKLRKKILWLTPEAQAVTIQQFEFDNLGTSQDRETWQTYNAIRWGQITPGMAGTSGKMLDIMGEDPIPIEVVNGMSKSERNKVADQWRDSYSGRADGYWNIVELRKAYRATRPELNEFLSWKWNIDSQYDSPAAYRAEVSESNPAAARWFANQRRDLVARYGTDVDKINAGLDQRTTSMEAFFAIHGHRYSRTDGEPVQPTEQSHDPIGAPREPVSESGVIGQANDYLTNMYGTSVDLRTMPASLRDPLIGILPADMQESVRAQFP